MKRDAEEQKARAKAAARERVLAEFERSHIGLAATATVSTSGKDVGERALHSSRLCSLKDTYTNAARGTKRKFAFDASAAEKSALEAEEAAARQIEREQAEALKAKLPDFWLPSLTPTYATTGPPTSLQDVKVQTTCRGGNPSHHLAYAAFPVT